MKCIERDCQHEAKWYPVLLLYADRKRYPACAPARSLFGIPTCDEHRAARTPENLVTDEGWRMISTAFSALGKVVPDREAIEVEFTEINGEEAQTFERLRAAPNN